MNQKKIACTITVIILFAGILFIKQRKSASQKKEAATQAEETAFTVKTEKAGRKDFSVYIKINGNVEANNTVSVYPDMNGKMIRPLVSLGSKVRKGDVIAEIDPSKPGEPYAASRVYAPISGSITSVPLKAGTTVSTATAVAMIGDINSLLISADVPERYSAVLQPGMKATVTFQAYPVSVFDAETVRVSPVVDSVSRTKQIYLSFDSRDSRINAGMFAKLKLYIKTYKNAVTVPDSAVIAGDNGTSVFLKNSAGTAYRKTITAGETVDGVTRVEAGLTGGESVITAGNTLLTDGAKIRDTGDPL